MATYTAIATIETDPGKPLKSDLAKRWSDNPLAIAEADASVPLTLLPSVLLGTLTTTSGTVQTLSGLVLTPYRFLYFMVDGVDFTTITALQLDGKIISATLSNASNVISGNITLSLATGAYVANTTDGLVAAVNAGLVGRTYVGKTAYSTATTSISFSGGTFNGGSILAYGIK